MNKQKEERLEKELQRARYELELIYNKHGVFCAIDEKKEIVICYSIKSNIPIKVR